MGKKKRLGEDGISSEILMPSSGPFMHPALKMMLEAIINCLGKAFTDDGLGCCDTAE